MNASFKKNKSRIIKIPFFIIALIFHFQVSSQSITKYTISGYITEKGSKENLPGANIYIPKLKIGVTSNIYGFYSIALAADTIELTVSYTGYQLSYFKLNLNTNTVLDIELEKSVQLNEVTLSANKNERLSDDVQMSKIDLSVEQIKNLPALLGEKDVLKAIQLLPGIQKGSEGSSGIYVRGGGQDQNLILLDEATVYNANHLFGFFSLFNGDALKSIELTKGGFPARYGGRLSSVIDMQMKDGDKEKIHGDIGIGLISSRLTIEGPIRKNKCSFLISGRRTYLDLLSKPFMKRQDNQLGYFFYDLNAKINYIINYKNKLYVSGYFGKDRFSLLRNGVDQNNDPTTGRSKIIWGNSTATVRWNHLINEKIFSNISFIFTDFLFNIGFEDKTINNFTKLNYFSGIRDYSIKGDVDFFLNSKNILKTGIIATYHHFRPKAVVLKGSESLPNFDTDTHINTYETAIYCEDDFKISEKWRTNTGIRFSNFNVRSKSYFNIEPRFSLKYSIKKDLSIKVSYATMNQYLHLLSNSGIGLPSDLWVPATDRIKPQQSQQFALGGVHEFKIQDLPFTISCEGYYKKSYNIIGYKEGASFINVSNVSPETAANITYEDLVTSGKAESYGAEIFFQKTTGKWTGWIGYTLSWIWLKFNDLNSGKRFPARYDRRHDLSIVQTYKINDRITLSAVWVYGTGNAITLPIASYQLIPQPSPFGQTPSSDAINHGYKNDLSNYNVNYYGEKNSLRMAAYHRLDLAVQFHKKKLKYERIFEVGVYNIYNRKNVFAYVTQTDYQTNTIKLVQITLFPIIPSISWSVKF